jgi:uncharacterized membrane protein
VKLDIGFLGIVTVTQAIKDRRPAEGTCQAVGEVGKILQDSFPIKSGDQDELQNLIIEHGPP